MAWSGLKGYTILEFFLFSLVPVFNGPVVADDSAVNFTRGSFQVVQFLLDAGDFRV